MRTLTLLLLATGLALVARPAPGQVPGSTARPSSAASTKAPAETPPYVTRMNDVEIPFSVRSGDSPDKQPTAVRVFVSWDRGASWHFFEEKKPEDGRFRFKPKQDGEYWFATQTVDRSGKSDNPEPRQPQLRLLIDTQKPQFLAQASIARAGEVSLSWSAADPTLQTASLKIEYQNASGAGAWQAVKVDASAMKTALGQLSGKVSFQPETSGKAINLRAEVADAAGNVAYFSQRVSLSLPSARSPAVNAPPLDRTATSWPSDNPFTARETGEEPLIAAEESADVPRVVSNPFARQDRLTSSGGTAETAEQLPEPSAGEVLPSPSSRTDDSTPPPTAFPRSVSSDGNSHEHGPPTENAALPPPQTEQSQPTADDIRPVETPPQPETIPNYSPAAPAQDEVVGTPPGSRPRLTSSRRFSLDYDVESVGPEGLADVELWGTSDGGRTWAKWGTDPDKQSPFDVEVNGESQYGFRVVIIGKSGLASNAPHAGDSADIWVGIDLTRPKARLVAAAYGQGATAGKLDIRWEASDEHLTSRPVTLAIGDRPDGAFTPIAAGLPNSGQYLWEYDPRSPRQIFLRLEVRDEAGNLAIDQLTEPIRIEGLQPKGRIRGFAPGGDGAGGAFRPSVYR
jgi:hypothetical protein